MQTNSFDVASITAAPNTYAGSFKVLVKCGQSTMFSDDDATGATFAANNLSPGCNHVITAQAQCLEGSTVKTTSETSTPISQCLSKYCVKHKFFKIYFEKA